MSTAANGHVRPPPQLATLSRAELVSARGGQRPKARVLKWGDHCDGPIVTVGVIGPYGPGPRVAICDGEGFGELAARYMK